MGGGDGDDLIGAREAFDLHGLEVSDEASEEWSESAGVGLLISCCN